MLLFVFLSSVLYFNVASSNDFEDPTQIYKFSAKRTVVSSAVCKIVLFKDFEIAKSGNADPCKRSLSRLFLTRKFEGANHVWNAICCPSRTSVLHLAAILGRKDLIEEIIRTSELSTHDPLTHSDHADRTALHLAAWNGKTECLRILLGTSCRAHLNTRTVPANGQVDRKPFPVDWADSFFHKHHEVEKLLPDIPEGSTPLHAATSRCNPECFQLLVDAGASLSIQDDHGSLAFEVLGKHYEPEAVPQVQVHRKRNTPHRYIERNTRPISTTFSFTAADKISSSAISEDSFVIIDEEPPDTDLSPERSSILIDKAREKIERIVKGLRLTRYDGASNSDALHSAVACNFELLVDFHLSRDVNIFEPNNNGDTVIFVTLANRNWTMLEKLLKICPELANTPNRSGDYPIHTATYLDGNEGVALLLEYGANPLTLTTQRSSVLHIAASYGKTNLLRELLGVGRNDPIFKLLGAPDNMGKTPLHYALECSSREQSETAWNILTKAGATIEARTYEGRSVLHTAIRYNNESMLPIILRSGESVVSKILDEIDNLGYTPLLYAIKSKNKFAVQTLLDSGASPDARMFVDGIGGDCSTLHLAASIGFVDIISLLLQRKPDLLHEKNALGWPALYVAAYCQRHETVSKLLTYGADLAYEVKTKNRKSKSTLTEIVENIRHADTLIETVLNSKISSNEHMEKHPDCEITVNYDVLIPEIDDELQSGRQMRIIDAFLNCGEKSCKRLICHTLVRSFLIKRWSAIWPCYGFLVLLHVLMVVAHTGIITGAVWGDLDSLQLLISRFTLACVAVFLAVKEIVSASQMARIHICDSQTWLKWVSLILAIFVALENPEYIHATTHPKALEELSSAESTLSSIVKERLWLRHVVAISALITWIELLLILSQIPRVGLQVQMFYKVAVSVTKMLLSFSILLIAFSFAFMVENRWEAPFATIFHSLGQTLVMMTSEFNYNDLFTDDDGFLRRMPFFLFLLFVAIVLMNLLIGLAVSDITDLKVQGRRRVLEQQAAFLIVLENVIYSKPVQKLLPEKWLSSLNRLISVNPEIILYPGKPRSRRIAWLMDISDDLPDDLQEDLIRISKSIKRS